MRNSVKDDYALLALFDLGLQKSHGPVKIAEISHRQRIPQKFLEQVLASLKQGGFVESRRGVEGGYLLARPADAITVGQVLRFLEGQGFSKRDSLRGVDTPFRDMWRQVGESITRVLDHTTIGEVCRSWEEKSSRFTPNWEI